MNHSILNSIFQVYRSYFTFGRIQIDRIAIGAGLKNKYSFEFDGIHHIDQLLEKQKGGILLTAHIGNFNLAQYFFSNKHNSAVVNLIMTDLEHEEIKNYLESVTGKGAINTIILRDDLSHVFMMNEALKKNELLVFAADRYYKDAKTYTEKLLGKPAKFPQGPFKIATRNHIPVLFVHIMREPDFHYHFYARPYNGESDSPKKLLKAYLEDLEKMVKKYPHQWYNYYDFWNDFN